MVREVISRLLETFGAKVSRARGPGSARGVGARATECRALQHCAARRERVRPGSESARIAAQSRWPGPGGSPHGAMYSRGSGACVAGLFPVPCSEAGRRAATRVGRGDDGRAELEQYEPGRNEARGVGTWKRARRHHLGSLRSPWNRLPLATRRRPHAAVERSDPVPSRTQPSANFRRRGARQSKGTSRRGARDSRQSEMLGRTAQPSAMRLREVPFSPEILRIA